MLTVRLPGVRPDLKKRTAAARIVSASRDRAVSILRREHHVATTHNMEMQGRIEVLERNNAELRKECERLGLEYIVQDDTVTVLIDSHWDLSRRILFLERVNKELQDSLQRATETEAQLRDEVARGRAELQKAHDCNTAHEKHIEVLECEGQVREDVLGDLLLKKELAMKFADVYAAGLLLDLSGILRNTFARGPTAAAFWEREVVAPPPPAESSVVIVCDDTIPLPLVPYSSTSSSSS